jgi:hypothetical protein
MLTSVENVNLALSHLGHTKSIADIDEPSQEARVARRWLDVAHRQLLGMHDWKIAQKTVTLNLVENDPTTEWLFSYRTPTDCIKPREIPFFTTGQSLQVLDPDDTVLSQIGNQIQIAFDIASDTTGGLIYSNAENAQLKYTKYMTIDKMHIEYCISLSYLLAKYLILPLGKTDMIGLAGKIENSFDISLVDAKANELNHTQVVQTNHSAFTLARR